MSRPDFIAACERVTREDEQTFKELWQRLGLSVDWRQEYQTIDAHCRRIAQYSFLDLCAKGQVESRFAPTMWDVDFQCAIAQAELEERVLPGCLPRHRVRRRGRRRVHRHIDDAPGAAAGVRGRDRAPR